MGTTDWSWLLPPAVPAEPAPQQRTTPEAAAAQAWYQPTAIDVRPASTAAVHVDKARGVGEEVEAALCVDEGVWLELGAPD